MEERPKITIELTLKDKLLEGIGWLMLINLWVYTLSMYNTLPETIPTHYGISGQADAWGSKATLLLLPIIGSVLFISMTILNRYPHIFNFPTKITVANALSQYTNVTRMIRYMKLSMVLLFSAIVYLTVQTSAGNAEGLGSLFLPVALGVVFIPMTYFVLKAVRKEQGN